LEDCITDEHGLSVHQSCHEKRILRNAASPRASDGQRADQKGRQLESNISGKGRVKMQDGEPRPPVASRPWEVIAEELSAEPNPKRALELAEELNRALENKRAGRDGKAHLADARPHPNSISSDYQKIVDDAVVAMRSDFASLQMLFPERGSGGELRLLAFRGFNPEAAQFWEWVRADSKSTCGIALRDRSRVVASNIATCDFMAGSEDQRTYLRTGIRACQTTPLIGSSGKVVGMISTHWRTPHQPSEKDFQLFDALARQAADVIESCSG
jgi:GAF domain-containing protein